MNIVLLCNDNYNQIALANKISKQFHLSGIVIEKRPFSKKKSSLLTFLNKAIDRVVFSKIHSGWNNLMDYYKANYSSFPKVQNIEVSNVNSEMTLSFIEQLKPDLLVVSGTSIIRDRILNIPIPKKIINLHTGLSPYIKGGPNCTNWCIALNRFDLIGNTIMWIDAGIDSGNVITTERTPLTGKETFNQIHIKVMEHAHDLYLRSIKKIKENPELVKSVPQDAIGTGKTFYSKDWNRHQKWNLLKNLRKRQRVIIEEDSKTIEL